MICYLCDFRLKLTLSDCGNCGKSSVARCLDCERFVSFDKCCIHCDSCGQCCRCDNFITTYNLVDISKYLSIVN
jgi:hypothetical protein